VEENGGEFFKMLEVNWKLRRVDRVKQLLDQTVPNN